jgi:3-phosphoshikimate 1-carboxyvinyltransferase
LGVASAQLKSAILLAGLGATAPVEVTEPALSRDHTELMLASCGVDVSREGLTTTVSPTDRLEPLDLSVPGDISSAAFAMTAALILPGSKLLLPGVGLNPTRTGILEIVNSLGARRSVTCSGDSVSAGERIGDIEIVSAELTGARVGGDLIPRSIDELPLLALLGCFAEGETVLTGAAELRVKESDRIEGVVSGLVGLGAEIEEMPDGFRVIGTGGITGGTLDARGDHRLAMLGAVSGLVSREGVDVEGFEAVEISYPDFESDIRSISV